MRKLLAIAIIFVLAAGCMGLGAKDEETTPTPTPSPDDPFPTPATPSPTPASPTPEPPTPSPTPATPTPTPATPTPEVPATQRINWTFNLTVGGASSPGGLPSSGTTNLNCVVIPSTYILVGMANATWTETASGLPGASPARLEILLQGAGNVSANVTGTSPLALAIPTIQKVGDSTLILQHESPPALPSQTSVRLDIWFDIPAADGAPGMPGGPTSCDRVA